MSVIIASILGLITASFVWFVAISNHRQAWIDALREDIADYFRHLEIIHYAIVDLSAAKTSDDLAVAEQKSATLAWQYYLFIDESNCG